MLWERFLYPRNDCQIISSLIFTTNIGAHDTSDVLLRGLALS